MSCQECSWHASPHWLRRRLPRRQTDCGQRVQPLPRCSPPRPLARQRRISQEFLSPDTRESSILVSITSETRGTCLDVRFCLVSSGVAGFTSITAAIQGRETQVPKGRQGPPDRIDGVRPRVRCECSQL